MHQYNTKTSQQDQSKANNSVTGNSTLIEHEKKQLEKIKQRQVIKIN